MKQNPQITIITINYNDKDGLEKTIESVIRQTYKEFEYIVIDGGSTDGSEELLKKHNDSIDFWSSEKDLGIYNAMNKGIKKANGKYLLFLNSGDELYHTEVLKNNISNIHSKDLIYFNINVVGDKETFIKEYPQELTFSYLYQDTIPHPATFIKKELFTNVGLYDESLKIVSDWKFFILALTKHNATYKYINSVFSTFYLDGVSSNKENLEMLLSERASVIKNEFFILKNDIENYLNYNRTIKELKASKKVKWLTKFNLINKI